MIEIEISHRNVFNTMKKKFHWLFQDVCEKMMFLSFGDTDACTGLYHYSNNMGFN